MGQDSSATVAGWLTRSWHPLFPSHLLCSISSNSSFLLLQQCAHKTMMSSIINRMKIETLLDPCHQSGLSNSPPGLHLAPSSNALVLPLSPVELNSGPFKTPGCLQDVSFRRRLERSDAHGPNQDARPKRPLPRVSKNNTVSRPTAMAKRLQIACPLKRCLKAFSDNRELRKHYTKAHLPSLKDECNLPILPPPFPLHYF
jgi:hypothetical protein